MLWVWSGEIGDDNIVFVCPSFVQKQKLSTLRGSAILGTKLILFFSSSSSSWCRNLNWWGSTVKRKHTSGSVNYQDIYIHQRKMMKVERKVNTDVSCRRSLILEAAEISRWVFTLEDIAREIWLVWLECVVVVVFGLNLEIFTYFGGYLYN